MSTPQPPNPLHPFDCMRSSFVGPRESVRCVEVDAETQRLYVASNANAVLVWDLTSRKPLAALKHPFWVNAVRRYPPVLPPWTPSAVSAVSAMATAPLSDHVLLTACEDGVVTAWSPETYKIVDQIRPGLAAVTSLHVVSPPPCGPPSGSPSSPRPRSTNDTLCFAASLEHVFVLQARPKLLVLQDLVHPGTCLTMHVASEPWLARGAHGGTSSATQTFSPLLVVGQEEGSIVCWSCARGTLQWNPIFGATSQRLEGTVEAEAAAMTYKDTLLYPANEPDVERDACESALIHKPGINVASGLLKNTFDYNSRRLGDESASALPRCDESAFDCTVPLQSPATKRTSRDATRIGQDELVHYDRRRVTCLAGAPAASLASATRFFSGHATGEILLWDTITGPRSRKCTITVLLKKLHAFTSGNWVWNLVPVTLPSPWYCESKADKTAPKQPLPSLVRKAPDASASKAIESASQPCSALLVACADSGDLVYLSCDDKVTVSTGPGFLFTAGGYWCSPPTDKSRWPAIHTVLGSFDGRIETFDVAAVVKRLREIVDAN